MTKIKVKEEVETTKELKELELRSIEVRHKNDPTDVVAKYYAWWGDGYSDYRFAVVSKDLKDLVEVPGAFNYDTLKNRLRNKCMDKLTS